MMRMVESSNNPCYSCSIKQYCCRNLKCLKLTELEYKRYFARHRKKLEVRRYDKVYLVSSKIGESCPYLCANKCIIYDNRPIECRLFPYTIGVVHSEQGRVLLSFHDRTICPNKKELLVSKDEAKAMVYSFARDEFGDEYVVKVKRESLLTRFEFFLKYLKKKIRKSPIE